MLTAARGAAVPNPSHPTRGPRHAEAVRVVRRGRSSVIRALFWCFSSLCFGVSCDLSFRETMEKKNRKTETHCFAPGCKTGYPGFRQGDGRTLSLFRVPEDDERRKQWERNLHRKDKPLCKSSAVCERHFEPRYIQRDYVHIINGLEVRVRRGKAGLAANAVPTLLPDLPAYLSKVSKKRPERKRPSDRAPPTKKACVCRVVMFTSRVRKRITMWLNQLNIASRLGFRTFLTTSPGSSFVIYRGCYACEGLRAMQFEGIVQ